MTKEDKYYTPDVEEFYVGFEYEITTGYDWAKKTFKHEDFNTFMYKHLDNAVSQQQVRVKYLCKKDITDLGFKKRKKDTWIGWNDYVIECEERFDNYFGFCTVHIPRMGEIYKICVHRYLTEECNIENDIENGESAILFKGYIKSKSELKQLLKNYLRVIK